VIPRIAPDLAFRRRLSDAACRIAWDDFEHARGHCRRLGTCSLITATNDKTAACEEKAFGRSLAIFNPVERSMSASIQAGS
jgi:hypothetical protein